MNTPRYLGTISKVSYFVTDAPGEGFQFNDMRDLFTWLARQSERPDSYDHPTNAVILTGHGVERLIVDCREWLTMLERMIR